MALRLILVGLVIALGLTLPSLGQVKKWNGSARRWVSTRVESFDPSIPTDQGPYRLAVAPDLLGGPSTACSQSPGVPALPEAVARVEPAEASVESPLLLIAPDAEPVVLAAAEPGVSLPLLIVEAEPVDELETPVPVVLIEVVPLDELDRVVEPTPGVEAVPAPVVVEVVPVDELELDELEMVVATAAAPAPTPVAVDVDVESVVTPSGVEDRDASMPAATSTSELDGDLAFSVALDDVIGSMVADDAFGLAQSEVLDSFADDRAADLAKLNPVATSTPAATASASDSHQADEGMYCGVAYALNSESVGDLPPTDAAIDAGVKDQSATSDQFSQAVRLTREAVYAWANVLHGPAVVTIEP